MMLVSWRVVVLMVMMVVVIDGDAQMLPQWKASVWGPQPVNTTDFTTYIWYGFSSNKVSFTRDDLKRLVECMSGHAQCPPIQQSPPVNAMANCSENKAITPTLCRMLEACTVGELLTAYQHEGKNITVEDLRQLLPVIAYMGQKGEVCSTKQGLTASNSKPRPSEVWGYGILFVTLISGCSLAGVSVLPLMAHKFYQQLLTLLVGLAVGSLAASSLFHLIPQAFKLADKDDHHGYLFVSLTVLLGIWSFFMVERFIKIILTHQARKERNSFPAGQSDQDILCCNNARELQTACPQIHHNGYDKTSAGQGKNGAKISREVESGPPPQSPPPQPQSACGGGNVELIYASQQQAIRASFGHDERPDTSTTHNHNHALEFRQGQDSVIRTVAWMIIFGDGFHNFIDGISIGAAFSESILTGISISLAVMCEELPHELGDFAVLLNAGMTMKQAVSYNFLSATTCYLGLVLGIVLGEFTQDNTAVFAVAAGMFLYIALVDMVPEMNEVASKAAEGGWKEAMQILLYQNIGIFIGIASLFCLAYFQDTMVLT